LLDAAATMFAAKGYDGTSIRSIASAVGMLPMLNAERDRYERRFEKLIAALPLDPATDRWLFKVALFGSLNWSQTWYRKGRYAPGEIAAAFIAIFQGQ
jgi:AcrR family transcriptional regulator